MPLWIAELTDMWWGVCVGGRHYTGHLSIINFECQRHPQFPKRIELERRLGRGEAKRMHEKDGFQWLRYPTMTNKFNSFDHLVRYAKRWCEQNLGDEWLLIRDDWYNPNEVLDAKGPMKEKIAALNALSEEWSVIQKTGKDNNKKIWDRYYKKWDKLIKS
jgi:hypothetical protein